ncbi:MAG: NADH-quinone oxidoreductase subunit J [Chitinophagales bacterium]|nr:NADH-quinone oxidoreductase subunit J [Chitinophagales bacterium]MDW8392804.1 NADH-quinone oxidoreductase subunit J [Chitinophagales bacterium]
MLQPDWILYILALMALAGGVMAVTTRRIFRAAVYLLFSLTALAGIYFWMHYEFMAAVQIIIYVGGIVVLIIFSLFLTHQTGQPLPEPAPLQRWGAAVLAAAAWVGMAVLLLDLPPALREAAMPTMSDIGSALLSVNETGMALPFEVITLLLLAAMVGCIVLALKDRTALNT